MAKSYRKYTQPQRDAIYELKAAGKSGEQIRRAVAAGHADLEPFSISGQHANNIAREEAESRGELYRSGIADLPLGDALDDLVRRMAETADRELERLERKQRAGRLDHKQLGALAQATNHIQRLAERRAEPSAPDPSPSKKGESAAPSSFAESLVSSGETVPDDPAPTPEVGDVVVGAQGGSFARADRRPDAVPIDPPDQGTTEAGRDRAQDGRAVDPSTTHEVEAAQPVPS